MNSVYGLSRWSQFLACRSTSLSYLEPWSCFSLDLCLQHGPDSAVIYRCDTLQLFHSPEMAGIKHIWAATWQNRQNECAPSEDSDQPGHPSSPTRVFAVRMKKAWILSYPLSAQRIPWSDWADAQADLSLRWAHSHFVGFFMSQLILEPIVNASTLCKLDESICHIRAVFAARYAKFSR